MARPRLDEQERRALGQRVRIAAELRLGGGGATGAEPDRGAMLSNTIK